MSIYHLKADGTGRVKPRGIQSILIDVVNQGDKNFELLLEGFVRRRKVAQILRRIPSGYPMNAIRLKEMKTKGQPFRLQITTNRATREKLRILVYAKKNGKIVNLFTNGHFVIEPEAGEYRT